MGRIRSGFACCRRSSHAQGYRPSQAIWHSAEYVPQQWKVPVMRQAIELAARAAVWTRHWAQGDLHSLPTTYPGNYGGELGRLWTETMATLPSGSSCLDVATGNGALLRLLLVANQDVSTTCVGVDLADLQPPWLHQLTPVDRMRVRLVPRTSIDSMPFQEAAFDHIFSQFGIEYAPAESGVPEIVRVLRIGGALTLVIHHESSVIVQGAAAECGHIDWLLMEGGLLDTARQMTLPMSLAGSEAGRAQLSKSPHFEAVRQQFDRLQTAAEDRVRDLHCPDVLGEADHSCALAFRRAAGGDLVGADALLAQYASHLQDARLRLAHLQQAAASEARIGQLLNIFASQGVDASTHQIRDQGRLMAWLVTGRKREPKGSRFVRPVAHS